MSTGDGSEDDTRAGQGSGYEKASWWQVEAEAEAAAHDKRLERMRQVGVVALAAIVLLPLQVMVLLVIVAGMAYLCIVATGILT